MLWRIVEHFEVGVKNFYLKNLYAKSLLKCCSKLLSKSCCFLHQFVLYLYCSTNLLDMVANRAKSRSLNAEDMPERLPQLTATVEWVVNWWWPLLGLDLITWSLAATGNWISAAFLSSLCCICLVES